MTLLSQGKFKKKGGLLLSHIALQYHRRKRAYLLCSEGEEVDPRRNNHLIFLQNDYPHTRTIIINKHNKKSSSKKKEENTFESMTTNMKLSGN